MVETLMDITHRVINVMIFVFILFAFIKFIRLYLLIRKPDTITHNAFKTIRAARKKQEALKMGKFEGALKRTYPDLTR